MKFLLTITVADPGFSVGGGGGANLQRGYFLAKMYAKTKELDPVGGRAPTAPPPRSANELRYIFVRIVRLFP